MKTNSELRSQAREALSGQWGIAVVATVIYSALVGLSATIAFAGPILIGLPIAWGFFVLFLEHHRNGEINLNVLFDGFKNYMNVVGTSLLLSIYIMLWSLLFCIPGIVKSYSYSMTFYLMKDDPELKYDAAIEKSKDMMYGHKMDLFLLDLSFIGWILLSVLTLGIGFLFVTPYMLSAHAGFYEELKNADSKDIKNALE